jgi:hypothetical protein
MQPSNVAFDGVRADGRLLITARTAVYVVTLARGGLPNH